MAGFSSGLGCDILGVRLSEAWISSCVCLYAYTLIVERRNIWLFLEFFAPRSWVFVCYTGGYFANSPCMVLIWPLEARPRLFFCFSRDMSRLKVVLCVCSGWTFNGDSPVWRISSSVCTRDLAGEIKWKQASSEFLNYWSVLLFISGGFARSLALHKNEPPCGVGKHGVPFLICYVMVLFLSRLVYACLGICGSSVERGGSFKKFSVFGRVMVCWSCFIFTTEGQK